MKAQKLQLDILEKDKILYEKLLNMNKQSNNKEIVPHYTLNGSGCRKVATQMEFPAYRISICFGLISLHTKQIFSFMVTASHNPAPDNGVKIGYANGQIISKKMFIEVQQCINSEQKFMAFITEKLNLLQTIDMKENIDRRVFVGRDCRESSPRLSQIVYSAFNQLGITVIDLGVCSTPELYSLSQHIQKNKLLQVIKQQQGNLQKIKKKYVDETLQQFQLIYNDLKSQKQNPQKKPLILLDFSNGSGAISYLRYKDRLQTYFQIKEVANKQFNNPNYQCGAQFYYKNWALVQESPQFQSFNQCFFFDGDSDRVICKADGCQNPFDGNYFLAAYILTLKRITKKIKQKLNLEQNKYQQLFNINAVGTSFTNLGVYNQLKKLNIQLQISQVGTLNLFRSAKLLKGTTVFFQPNGHGGVYFSKKNVQIINQLNLLYPDVFQIKFLDSIYKILKNNSRGYGLHNMLVYFLCKRYMNDISLSNLIVFAQQNKCQIYLNEESDILFKNGAQKNNKLVSPNQFTAFIDQLRKQYKDYQITIRKSQTQRCLIRMITQGLNINICKTINRKIYEHFKNLGYLMKKT